MMTTTSCGQRHSQDVQIAKAFQATIAVNFVADAINAGSINGKIYSGFINDETLKLKVKSPVYLEKIKQILDRKWDKNIDGDYVTKSNQLVYLNIDYHNKSITVRFEFYDDHKKFETRAYSEATVPDEFGYDEGVK